MLTTIAKIFASFTSRPVAYFEDVARLASERAGRALSEAQAAWRAVETAQDVWDKASAANDCNPSAATGKALEKARRAAKEALAYAERLQAVQERADAVELEARANLESGRVAHRIAEARHEADRASANGGEIAATVARVLAGAQELGAVAVGRAVESAARTGKRLSLEAEHGVLDPAELADLASDDATTARTAHALAIIVAAEALRAQGAALLDAVLVTQGEALRLAGKLGGAAASVAAGEGEGLPTGAPDAGKAILPDAPAADDEDAFPLESSRVTSWPSRHGAPHLLN